MREAFAADLVADVLGPRAGVRETISDSPLSEYITGVLSPVVDAEQRDIEGAAELLTDEYVAETEETAETDTTSEVVPFAPVLDPQRRPFSMGLSFLIESLAATPVFDVCVTWARYSRMGEGSASRWTRGPRFSILPGLTNASTTLWLNSSGQPVPAESPGIEVSVHIMPRPVSAHRVLVTLHLVNRVEVPHDQHASAELHVYQPQMRVVCGRGSQVVPGLESLTEDEEERVLEFIYRDHPVLARGHLTSAVWAAVDPERPVDNVTLDFPAARTTAPFLWVDGELLTPPERERFTVPDVRTEYVPLASIPMPDFGLHAGYGQEAELDADRLAESWRTGAIEDALAPLCRSYRRWIADQHQQLGRLNAGQADIGRRLLRGCERAADRIERGLDILRLDEDARLAFCFAMRAMALQHSWGTGPAQALRWHPFQLAFILTALDSIVHPMGDDWQTCDLLWIPTGGGKTEAYLALIAFTLAHRRRVSARRARAGLQGDLTGAGVAVISRYTLRLLTIQQFRRTLKLVAACEKLRVHGLGAGAVGWRPAAFVSTEPLLWGAPRFSAGLWVGQSVAPNKLEDTWANGPIPGALSILRTGRGDGEPAQVLRCPACDTVLAIPQDLAERVPTDGYVLHWVVRGNVMRPERLIGVSQDGVTIRVVRCVPLDEPDHSTLTVSVGGTETISAGTVDQLWSQVKDLLGNISLACVRAARPGYFFRYYSGKQGAYDFEVFCPSPACPLHERWFEGVPAGCVHGAPAQAGGPPGGQAGIPRFPTPLRLAHVNAPFRASSVFVADRVPIPAYMVDDQVYHRCPSVVIATVDKFARPAFEPRAAALFGNVDRHHCVHGYYREYLHSGNRDRPHPSPEGRGATQTWAQIPLLDPPSLMIQDELHLIEGPLGSLVGLYEAAVDGLCRDSTGRSIKYIASTATVRQASEQVRSVFDRELMMFPPPGLSADDSFFVRFATRHPLADQEPGRLYAGVCAPGRGPLTPILRLWARMLQTAFKHATHQRIDPFWTLTGYFNAIRELAGARALYRQDIPERLDLLARLDPVAGAQPRPLPEDSAQELSGRMESTHLPTVLDLLNEPQGQDALFTTSMFGTGVDVQRLSLMIVNGQPKTTSSYIQATGRVGRRCGALVVTFLRASRPRDLNHYEFFCGYHVQMHRFVEPVTVMPFAPGVLDRALGPVSVFLLRNRRATAAQWSAEGRAPQMIRLRATDRDVLNIPHELERRAATQPPTRRPPVNAVLLRTNSALDDWQAVASRNQQSLRYWEHAEIPTCPVVLGDAQHQHRGLEVAYENAPQSLRDIEETCGFQT